MPLGHSFWMWKRAHARNLAQPAAAHKLRHLAAHGRGAAMQPGLANPPVPLHRLDHRAPFRDAQRGGLLDIDILPGLAGVDGLQGVPVVGRGDDHGVHVLQLEELAVVLEPLGVGADLLRGKVEVGLVDVADGDDLSVALLEKGVQHLVAAVAHADEAEAHAVVGAEDAEGRKRGGGADGCKGPGEFAAGDWFHRVCAWASSGCACREADELITSGGRIRPRTSVAGRPGNTARTTGRSAGCVPGYRCSRDSLCRAARRQPCSSPSRGRRQHERR